MYTIITNIETFDYSVLLNDNWSNNLQIELNDWKLINALDYYDPEVLWFKWDNVNKLSHNAIKLPSWKHIIYYKPLARVITRERIESMSKIFEEIDYKNSSDYSDNSVEPNNVNMLLPDYIYWEWFWLVFFASGYKEHWFSNNDEYLIDMFLDI